MALSYHVGKLRSLFTRKAHAVVDGNSAVLMGVAMSVS